MDEKRKLLSTEGKACLWFFGSMIMALAVGYVVTFYVWHPANPRLEMPIASAYAFIVLVIGLPMSLHTLRAGQK